MCVILRLGEGRPPTTLASVEAAFHLFHEKTKTEVSSIMPHTLDQQELHFAVQEECATEMRIAGETDGAFGYKPKYAHEDYLIGYCYGIKFLTTDCNGKILY